MLNNKVIVVSGVSNLIKIKDDLVNEHAVNTYTYRQRNSQYYNYNIYVTY